MANHASQQIAFACPNPECGRPIRLSAAAAGRKGKCPHCSKVVTAPSLPGPNSHRTIVSTAIASERTREVSLSVYVGRRRYKITAAAQAVANPRRALRTFKDVEAGEAAVSHFGIGLVALLMAAGAAILGGVAILIDQSSKGDALPLNLVGVLLIGGAALYGPLMFLERAAAGIRAFCVSCSLPKRSTAADTVESFFQAVKWDLWHRAHNCLTDSARLVRGANGPSIGPNRGQRQAISLTSLQSFKRFWSGISDGWSAGFDSLHLDSINDDAVKISLPLRFTSGEGEHKKTNEYLSAFVVVQRGTYWFIASGFFWVDDADALNAATDQPGGMAVKAAACPKCGFAFGWDGVRCRHCKYEHAPIAASSG